MQRQEIKSESKTIAIDPTAYAVVGAASMLGGVTRLSVSLVAIFFELTGNDFLCVSLERYSGLKQSMYRSHRFGTADHAQRRRS